MTKWNNNTVQAEGLLYRTPGTNDNASSSGTFTSTGYRAKSRDLSLATIQSFLQNQRGSSSLTVTEFSQMTGGYGKQTFSCLVKDECTQQIEDLIIRKCDAVPIIERGMYRVEQEFELLRALSTTGLPVPNPLELGSDVPEVDGSFYTMARIHGQVPSSYLGLGEMEFSEKLVLRLAELLGELHSIPLRTFKRYEESYEKPGSLDLSVKERYRENIITWREYVSTIPHLQSPYLTWLFDWLEQHIPDDHRPVVSPRT